MGHKNREEKNQYQRLYRQKNADKLREQAREKYAEDPSRQKNASIKYKYKISLEEYTRRLEEQGGVCAICGTDQDSGRGRFHIDHDHACCPTDKTCGKCLRGILCSLCNTRLGVWESEWRLKAMEYLTKYATENLRAVLYDTIIEPDGTDD